MALPLRGDPARPLHLGASSTLVLGVIALIFAALVGLFAPSRAGATTAWFRIIGIGFYGAIGAGFIALSILIKRRHLWAIIVTLVLVGMILVGLAMIIWGLFVSGALTASPVPGLIVALIMVALVQMVFHLVQGYRFIRSASPPPGFAPIMPVAVVPPLPAEQMPQQPM